MSSFFQIFYSNLEANHQIETVAVRMCVKYVKLLALLKVKIEKFEVSHNPISNLLFSTESKPQEPPLNKSVVWRNLNFKRAKFSLFCSIFCFC